MVKANFLLLENFYGKISYALLTSRYVGRAGLVIKVRQSLKQIMVFSILPKNLMTSRPDRFAYSNIAVNSFKLLLKLGPGGL